MNLGKLKKRQQLIRTWRGRLQQNLAEMEAELKAELPLLIVLTTDTLEELAAYDQQLTRAAEQMLSPLNRALCRVQTPEEP